MMKLAKTTEYETWAAKLRDPIARRALVKRLMRVELGLFGDTKALGDGVHELRIDVGPGYRVYYAKHGDVVVVLLAGGDKSTQIADIKLARALWKAIQGKK